MPHNAIRSITVRTESCLLDIVMGRTGTDGKNRKSHQCLFLGRGAKKWVSGCKGMRIQGKLVFQQ